MSLTLVVGRPNAGKTGVLYDVVRRSAADGGAPVVALPSRPDAMAVAREFALQGPGLGVTVAALDDCIDDCWAIYGDGRSVVGPTERSAVLRRASRACELTELRSSGESAGFTRLLEPLVANLAAPIEHARLAPGAAREIAEILSAYRGLLVEAQLIERAEAVRLLERSMSASWFGGPLVANRFADLTALQERFLVAAARHTDVWLAIPWQEGFPATRALDPLIERLAAAGAEVVAEPPRDYTPSEELRYVETHLFVGVESVLDTPRLGDVRLSHAYGEEAEGHRIAAEVQAAVGEGVPAEQIAVVFEEAGEHAPALRQAFREAGIEADFDVVRPARDTGWGRALAHLSAFAAGGSRSDLLGFLRTPYSGVSREAAEALEARWRCHRVHRPDRLRASLHEQDPQAASVVYTAADMIEEETKRELGCDGRKWHSIADALLKNAYAATGETLDAEGIADASAHRAFLRLVSSLGDRPGALGSSRELIDAFLDTRIAVVEALRAGAVRVMSASRARSKRFQVVIIGGLSKGDFPKPRSEDVLQATGVAAALADAGIEVLRRDEQDAARLTFYLVASRATKRLVLSRQVAASDGSDLAASWLLEELLDLYRRPEAEVVDDEPMPPVEVLGFDGRGTAYAAPPSRRRTLREAALGAAVSGGAEGAGAVALAARRARRRDALLTDERVLAALCERQVFSATEIEAYLRCPYAWFHERVVRAEGLEFEVEATERGRLVHEALRRVYEQLPDVLGQARVSQDNVSEVLGLAGEVLRRVIEERGEATTIAQWSTAGVARRLVLGFLRADAVFLPGFEPMALEFAFGPDVATFAGFQLRGRMDRVDRGPNDELVVTDYKTGTVDAGHSATKFERSGLVQLALYARVASAAFGAPVAAGLYRRVSGQNVRLKLNRGFYTDEVAGAGLVSTDRTAPDDIAEIIGVAERRAGEAVNRMREGRIPAEPLDAKACDRCRLRGFCPGVRR